MVGRTAKGSRTLTSWRHRVRHWGPTLALLVVPTAGALATRPAAAAQDPIKEVRRFVLVVGANDGGPERVKLRYAVDDATAVSDVLAEVGGLAGPDRRVLANPTVAELLWAVGEIAERVEDAQDSGANVQFLFYYSGHSDERGLLLGKEKMNYRELRKTIDVVPADVRLAILDSCASGAFTRLKGGRKRAPFLVGTAADVKGHAFLTSSSADEVAQESDRVGGSFFTHYFTTGLRGAADADGDKLVTLSEAYEFAFDETLAQTETSRGGAQHAAYDINLTGSGDLVLTDLRRTTARLVLESEIGGRVFVRKVGGELAAELYKPPGSNSVQLALVPGRYQITVDDGASLRRAETVVRTKESAVLEESMLREIPREATRARGGGATPPSEYEHLPFNIGLFPPLSMNGQSNARKQNRKIKNTVSLGFVWAAAHKIDGVSMAFGGNVAYDEVDGAQLSIGANVSKGHVGGAQLSQVINIARSVRGVQGATVNWAKTVYGAQFGLVNVGGDFTGAQVGLVNVGKKFRGAQVGIFSYAETADAQVSLLGITKEFGVHPSVWTSDTALLNLGLRFPARRTYTELVVGLHPLRKNTSWQFGTIFGIHNPIRRSLFVDVDLMTVGVANGFGFRQPLGGLIKLRAMFGWQPFKRLAIYGGPTFNVMVDRFEDSTGDTVRPGYGWATTVVEDDPAPAIPGTPPSQNERVRIWPGFLAGLRF